MTTSEVGPAEESEELIQNSNAISGSLHGIRQIESDVTFPDFPDVSKGTGTKHLLLEFERPKE